MAEVLSATRAARVSSRWQRRSSAPLAPRRSAGLDLNQEPCAYCGFAVPSIGCRYCPCSRRPALCDATCMARFWQHHKPSCDWHETRKLILDLLGVGSVSTLVMRYVGRMPRGPSGQEDAPDADEYDDGWQHWYWLALNHRLPGQTWSLRNPGPVGLDLLENWPEPRLHDEEGEEGAPGAERRRRPGGRMG